MNTIEDIREFMTRCVGYADQSGWLSESPVDPQYKTGFTYCIHDTIHDKFYIGCKLFWFKRKMTVQGKKKRVTKESDWRSYYGSSKPLNAIIAEYGEDSFDRYLLQTWESKRSLQNAEATLQHKLDVLTAEHPDGSYLYYNQYVGKAFRSDTYTEELKRTK